MSLFSDAFNYLFGTDHPHKCAYCGKPGRLKRISRTSKIQLLSCPCGFTTYYEDSSVQFDAGSAGV